MTVEVDTSELEAGIRQLAADLDRAIEPAAMAAARQVASSVASYVPKRSGRLAATVDAVPFPNGAGVTYGGSLLYAGYIDKRTGATDKGTEGAAAKFRAAMNAAAATVIGRL